MKHNHPKIDEFIYDLGSDISWKYEVLLQLFYKTLNIVSLITNLARKFPYWAVSESKDSPQDWIDSQSFY